MTPKNTGDSKKINPQNSKKAQKNSIPRFTETLVVGIILALAGGFMDAYTFLLRGEVFANAQTGNMVFFGIFLSQGRYLLALSYLLPVAAFFAGVLVAEYTKRHYTPSGRIHWRQTIILFEIIITIIVAFIPSSMNIAVNIMISFVCSLQVQSFRKLDGNIYSTTMCTGNLRSATEQLYNFKKTHDISALKKSLEYYCIIIMFIAGAITGAISCRFLGNYAIFISAVLLFTVFVLMFFKKDDLLAEEAQSKN